MQNCKNSQKSNLKQIYSQAKNQLIFSGIEIHVRKFEVEYIRRIIRPNPIIIIKSMFRENGVISLLVG